MTLPKDLTAQPALSRGRAFTERDDGPRGPRDAFQRDRDRIVHSVAFRRLRHKTQVFVAPDGDHFRVRLTHSIEVAQIGRSMARALGLNEDLTEALCLAHDLGHPPFGHAGEDSLSAALADAGGFDHNGHTLRLVTRIEAPYPDFAGLNLSWETLEGLAKHNGPVAAPGWALLEADSGAGAEATFGLELGAWPSLEAQVAAIADDIAYSHHDLHDGLRSGLFSEVDLMDLPVTGPAFAEVDRLYPGLERMRRRHEALRRVFGRMVEDVIAVAKNRLEAARPRSAQDVRQLGTTVIRFSKPLYQDLKAIRGFLFTRMYRAPPVMKERARVTQVVNALFPLFMDQPVLLPAEWQADVADARDVTALARIVADYVAGMTDRFALQEHARLCGPL